MPILENKCTNCADRGRCRDEGAVVTWKHCGSFRPDKELLKDEKAVRAYEIYARARQAEREMRRAAMEKRVRPVRAVEQVWPDGTRIRLFPGGSVEAAEALGLSRNQVYDRLAKKGEPSQGDCYGLRYAPAEQEDTAK